LWGYSLGKNNVNILLPRTGKASCHLRNAAAVECRGYRYSKRATKQGFHVEASVRKVVGVVFSQTNRGPFTLSISSLLPLAEKITEKILGFRVQGWGFGVQGWSEGMLRVRRMATASV
jgi:hypothetical protein